MASLFSAVEMQEFSEFDWHETKQIENFRKHKIDLDDAIRLFLRRHILRRSDRHGEERYLAVGMVDEELVAIIYTMRADVCRVISARRARKDEQRAYHQAIGRGSGEPPR
jgi:uncharacterized DUF497 family protein